jgi:hypothetical protein
MNRLGDGHQDIIRHLKWNFTMVIRQDESPTRCSGPDCREHIPLGIIR